MEDDGKGIEKRMQVMVDGDAKTSVIDVGYLPPPPAPPTPPRRD